MPPLKRARPALTGLTLMLALTCFATPWAEAGADAEASPKIQRWVDRCTDFTRNGWAFKAPANFLPWLDVFSDPGVWLEFARRGLDPRTYIHTAGSLLEPGMVKNYLEWGDPLIYEKWANALAEPQFITAVNATLFDPGKFMRWAMLPLEPKVWQIALAAASPETWLTWLNAPLSPEAQALLAKSADPNTYARLLEALQDPANYPGFRVAEPAAAVRD